MDHLFVACCLFTIEREEGEISQSDRDCQREGKKRKILTDQRTRKMIDVNLRHLLLFKE